MSSWKNLMARLAASCLRGRLGATSDQGGCQSTLRWLCLLTLAVSLQGCGLFSDPPAPSLPPALGAMPPGILPESVSLAQIQAALKTDVALRIHAADVLNTDANGRSLSVVTRIYRLKDASAFLQTPYEAFQRSGSEPPPAFAADVLDSRELVLTPGQRHEVVEALPKSAAAVGVVALFRAPAPGRWRFAFDTQASRDSGITLGVHGCALSVSHGAAIGASAELQRVAGARCATPPAPPQGGAPPTN